MASIVYDSFLDDLAKGNIDLDTDAFYGMFVQAAYTPNKGTHTKRSDITNEASGAGYSSGGAATTVTLTKDTTNHREDVAFAQISIPTATITWRYCVIYKRRGGAASADELVACVDNGSDTVSTGGTALQQFTSPLRFQN